MRRRMSVLTGSSRDWEDLAAASAFCFSPLSRSRMRIKLEFALGTTFALNTACTRKYTAAFRTENLYSRIARGTGVGSKDVFREQVDRFPASGA